MTYAPGTIMRSGFGTSMRVRMVLVARLTELSTKTTLPLRDHSPCGSAAVVDASPSFCMRRRAGMSSCTGSNSTHSGSSWRMVTRRSLLDTLVPA